MPKSPQKQAAFQVGEVFAIDWSAPSALYWRMSDLDDLNLLKVFLPTRFTDHAGLFFATPYNAAEFRPQLKRAQAYAASKGSLDNWDRMVVVGHSMGGGISKASLIEPGDRFFKASYSRPIDLANSQLHLKGQ
ncbi:MAG: hypothetical protein QNL33_20225 [Akkermansiaceae bacterium]